ncbi:MAG: DNA cytosine methyltransferase [Nostoc sp. DedVER02]|uniref:DNA cytosine methyltransferase n=1 Tax=unclassified Nostoc TaxID=2593658 RepID=UPI002AD58178|nr:MULTISPECIES: DNA cytosine methyltransferase [unclassified Nostoc]MDZ7989694.1 DNA cytosine methyltransferase [Nostoc sp. DedVER02]MDZ8113430.1 DNA cytosine methyltransferase [Nostoc sp. DedVER01b]
MNSTATNKKIAVSLFSGVGGFDLGFNAAGFEIVIAIDNNPIALATYQHNFPHTTVLCKDIWEVTGEEIRACIQAKYVDWDGEIHAVFGGPPCQGFSVAGLQNVEDERNSLVGEFVRLWCWNSIPLRQSWRMCRGLRIRSLAPSPIPSKQC